MRLWCGFCVGFRMTGGFCASAPAHLSCAATSRGLTLDNRSVAATPAVASVAVSDVSRFWWGDQRGLRPIKPVAPSRRHGRGSPPLR